jgi:hypothetical protein
MEKLEEVLGSSMCQYSSIEKRLAILYRNQVKIYDAITKEQQGYSEEEVLELIQFLSDKEDFKENSLISIFIAEDYLNKFKNK